ncbi:aldo/keto reductase [Nocardioides marmoribigeumensis]|uniref:Aryl-alcohol dehydrogenase-like predicted oxidoreductase n=1 Tax=Nocardioides marmoribigeumensis TaxID=433649 RepID=A0ABU2BWZ5_9ACTN|nr:aldo/keto reductase [Nocardioides marmoribigeumensis]MDR7362584.1 aryl-alcohol dehydrogenase-like predicted oxidoreductase [Nocardioides marmoribigeumensis]
MQTRQIGTRTVSALGLGGMPMSVREENDPERAEATIRAALDLGVTLIDTADAYSRDEDELGHNEELIAGVLRKVGLGPDDVLVATKGGHTRRGTDWDLDGSPDHLKRACRASLQRLGVDSIGLYQHHRPDPAVPYAETIGALKELYDEGLIQAAGLSNADPDQIREARGILGEALVSVQNQFSPVFRSSRPEIDLCADLGLAFLAWSPLGGMGGAGDLGSDAKPFAEVAEKHGVSPQQVALAWELALSPVVIPIPGASRPESVQDSFRATELVLDEDDVAALDVS